MRRLTPLLLLSAVVITAGCASSAPRLGEDPEVRLLIVASDFNPEIHNVPVTRGTVGRGMAAGATELGAEAMRDCGSADPLALLFVPICGLMGATIGGVAGGLFAGVEGASRSIPEAEEHVLRTAAMTTPTEQALEAHFRARLAHHAALRGRRIAPTARQLLEVHVSGMRWVFGAGDTAAVEATFTIRTGTTARGAERSWTFTTERLKAADWAERNGAPVAEALRALLDRGAARAWSMLDGELPLREETAA